MKIRYSVLLAVAAATASIAAPNAADQRLTREYHRCMDTSGEIDANIANCNSEENDRQDGRLNQAYGMVMRQLPAPKKAALRQSERAWIRQRDLGCKRDAEVEAGGTIYNVMLSGCILDETIKRTLFLERYR